MVKSNRETIFIIGPSLGMVGQARVAALLQRAFIDIGYNAIVVGYAPPSYKLEEYVGPVIRLPWFSCLGPAKYFIRLCCFLSLVYQMSPKFIVGQGLAGGVFSSIAKKFGSNARYILSIHEAIVGRSYDKGWRKYMINFVGRPDGMHYVSHGLAEEYEIFFKGIRTFVIPNPIDN